MRRNCHNGWAKRDRDKLYCKNSICTADKDQNTCCKPCDCTCPNGTPEATCTVATAGKEDCAKCNQDEDKPGRNYCLRYISPGDENGRQKCGKCTSICDNGNAEDPGYSTRDGEHLCASCHKGFYLHNDKSCHRCKCTCLNGIAKSGSACECTSTSSERVNCNSCNKPGRGKANNYCERNIKGTNLKQCQKCTATCEHGTPKPAGWVKFDNENNCASCDNIAALITSPEHSAYKICEKRICVCPIPHNQPDYEPTTSDRVGVAPVGAECPRHGMLKCKSCYQENGYEMNATTSLCVWKVCTCPGGTPVEGPPCNHTGLHHCGNCTGPKYVLEIPMIPGLGSNLTTVPETSTWAWAQGVYVDANASDIVEDTGPTLPYCRRACVSLAPPEGEEEDSNDENATITSAEDDDPDATREEASDEDAASSSSSMLNFHDYLYDKNINKNKLQTKMRGKLRNSRTSSRKRTLRTEHKTDKKSTTLFTSTSHNTTRTRMTRRKALAVDHIGQTSDPQIIDADDEPLEENKSSSELEDDEIDPDDDNDPDDENDPDDDEEMGGATSRKEISKNSGVPRRARASAHRSSHLQQTTWRSRDNETDTRDEDEVTDESKEICFAVKREVLTEDKGPLCKTHICKRDDDHEVCCGLLCAADKAKLAPICEKFGKEVDDEALCDHRDCTPGLCCRDLSFLALHGAKLGVGGVLVLLYLYQSGYFSVGDAFEAEIEDE
ncbi:unnamed protein product [Amoebophrya sp. A25]|nr:unnamed protein product [Amoebophrya sp. A25]|eukprot:GSA25T00012828001.1